MATKPASVTVKVDAGSEYALARQGTARINPRNCVNCGTCREYCPVDAIQEKQREICRICPDCAPNPALAFKEMQDLPTARSCTTACPLGISPQGYVNLLRRGKPEAAYKLIWEKNPLPSVCGRICHHPCEQDCKRGILIDKPIAIRGLKRFLAENLGQWRPEPYPRKYDETVGVVGSGPAGLAAAHCLAQMGYEVTIIDEASEPGGMLIRGIPGFRLPRDVVRKEIAGIKAAGIRFRMGEKVGKANLKRVAADFDAVVVAAGAPSSKELKLPGWRNEGILGAVDFMERINHNQEVSRHPSQEFKLEGNVVVIGGGSVAIDAARSALRAGAAKVSVVCMECGEQIPCHPWEMEEALEEGIELLQGLVPQKFTGSLSRVDGVEVCDVDEFRKEADGRIFCTEKEGTERIIPADWVVVAIGQAADPLWKESAGTYPIFFAGDVASPKCSVIDAMAGGRAAAMEADTFLRHRIMKDPAASRTLEGAPIEEKIYPAMRIKVKRDGVPVRAAASRVSDFDEVELALSGEAARAETVSCLQCGYQEVDPKRCIGCGVCLKVCPAGDVITMIPAEKED